MPATALALLRCMRPKQWTKNGFLFAGLLFTSHVMEAPVVVRVVAGFALFCVLSGVVYILNDVADVEQDRLHPRKRLRPIASGELGVGVARGAALALAAASLGGSFALGWRFGAVAALYLALNLAYNVRLKHVVILDVFCIALGFVLRALAGLAAFLPLHPDLPVTPWFLSCTFFLALFLAICKRRHEAVILNDVGALHRKVLEEYSAEFLDQMVAVATTSTILTYALWTTLTRFESKHMVYTLPFVVFGIFRYLYLVYKREEGGEPEQLLLTDWPLLAGIVAWFAVVLILLV
ncbi:MAG: decaprenyl-phosphate phosphoribosyltransferase [Candidatus Sumerlaeota bacterium]|nr:decaprenyl-phosphate phosphoribosyltransferase [Candidatus Sumerlaeota bacterium]